MEIRPLTHDDLIRVGDIDATIEAISYLHLTRAGEDLNITWKTEERPLRQKSIQTCPLDEESRFALKQIVSGMDDGLALGAEHDNQLASLLLARPEPGGLLRILDLRVDHDFRRQGLGTALVFRAIQHARELGLRAVTALARTDNLPASMLLLKTGFDLGGMDVRHFTNHDLVKESAALFWYAALD